MFLVDMADLFGWNIIFREKMSDRCNLGETGQTKDMVFGILKKALIRFF